MYNIFKPEEITVNFTKENNITIEDKQEEKVNEHIYRRFIRLYLSKDTKD